jgi:hypothetical protein
MKTVRTPANPPRTPVSNWDHRNGLYHLLYSSIFQFIIHGERVGLVGESERGLTSSCGRGWFDVNNLLLSEDRVGTHHAGSELIFHDFWDGYSPFNTRRRLKHWRSVCISTHSGLTVGNGRVTLDMNIRQTHHPHVDRDHLRRKVENNSLNCPDNAWVPERQVVEGYEGKWTIWWKIHRKGSGQSLGYVCDCIKIQHILQWMSVIHTARYCGYTRFEGLMRDASHEGCREVIASVKSDEIFRGDQCPQMLFSP